MSAADQGPAGSSLTREQVLDELELLAKVEHALVVECLSVCYALGYDLAGLNRTARDLNLADVQPPAEVPARSWAWARRTDGAWAWRGRR